MAERVLATPAKPSFAKLHPEYEGCCQGNRQTCKCGAIGRLAMVIFR